jgi:enoyl-CoA hydratase/carnithine racemase
VAKVSGLALGGGVELPLACDYVYASDRCKTMGLPETKYGIFPAWGGTELLSRRVGKALARWMVLEGGLMGKGGKGPAILDATQAKQIGLVDEVIPALDLDRVVQEKIASGTLKKRKWSIPNTGDVLKKVPAQWTARVNRYEVASLKELAANELKGLYFPALQLADERLTKSAAGKKVGRIQRERDMFRMANNMDGAERAGKKAAAEAAKKAEAEKPKA